MPSIEVYSPRDANLHLTLPHDHANSIYTTSPFSYTLDEELDFVEVFPTGERRHSLVALDPNFVSALFWALTRVKQVINRATQGAVPAVGVNAVIPDEFFDNLGMKKPKLLSLLERTDINPLRCFGDRYTLKQIVLGLQQFGREAIDWITEARWRSQLMGNQSFWDWEDPRASRGLSAVLGDYQPFPRAPTNSPISSNSDSSLPSSPSDSTIGIAPNSPRYILLPFSESRDNSPSPVPDSPRCAILPFSESRDTSPSPTPSEDVEVLLQLVLHPTASRYALRYPLTNMFDGQPLIDNGYVGDGEDEAMDVDEE